MNEQNTYGSKVYKYTVYWLNYPVYGPEIWKRKTFTQKRDAKQFARKEKKRSVKPYPYIVQGITDRTVFRQDVVTEAVKGDFDYVTMGNYRKIIRY